ncbi:metalloregulator ArsR/SmtB family transcription factor [Paenibacillus terrigena]|uniref:DUF2087 domain-containing protein n=1 Tax=Paenibacillus terrigena TaxID=369333 RepID=UPI0003709598|nr:metalloregulator ArsR/SmtB family transcription factor [Paenibacillus terrigena]
MQLDRLVRFHKTIGDVTRIRILALLKNGPLHGQALADKLSVSAPTITHHMAKLREVDLIYERRDKNTIYFYLDEKSLIQQSEAIVKKVQSAAELVTSADQEKVRQDELKAESILRNFFTKEGTLKHLPAQHKKKLLVLHHLVEGLQPGKKYLESELNDYIRQFHPDFATIRREFIMNHFMYREQDIYELNPRELWGTSKL